MRDEPLAELLRAIPPGNSEQTLWLAIPAHPSGPPPQRPFADLVEHLKALRRAAGLPQRGLAEAAHICPGAVQRLESGAARPPRPSLTPICAPAEPAPPTRRRPVTCSPAAGAHSTASSAYSRPRWPSSSSAPSASSASLWPGVRTGRCALPQRCPPHPRREPISRTTAWRIVNRKALPASVEQLITFPTACRILPATQRLYFDACSHVISQRGTHRFPPGAQRGQRIRRVHPVALARGGSDTDTAYGLAGLAAVLPAAGKSPRGRYRPLRPQPSRRGPPGAR
ncbi:helix-turn-helix domain-containing protein [Streptomyces sp. NPDC056944]|uniref:helix-turn-helix domain-containing protein n=1 Tax=Streptomyces sp. NPDC056944 TaxID=3345972 RepID=UPI0036371641